MSNSRILSVYKSRVNIIAYLKREGYDVSEYEDFSVNEVDAMYSNSQLDMLVLHPVNKTQAYIRYNITDSKNAKVDDIVRDLFEVSNELTKKDMIVIICDNEPNETTLMRLTYLFNHSGIFVVMHNLQRLLFNIHTVSRVPQHRVLSEFETEQVLKKYNLANVSQMPEISRYDPVALAIFIRPGQVCEITRNSPTSGYAVTYRVCVSA